MNVTSNAIRSAILKKSIRSLDSLPAMPVIAQKILALPLDTDSGEGQLLRLIEQDPQISARIIGLANTPLFGASKKVTSVQDAAMLLGITRIKSVAVGIALMSTLNKQPMGMLNLQQLWLHSLSVALGMRTLARAMPSRIRPLDDEIFLAGLLHDIGFMVLNYLDTAQCDQLLNKLAADTDRDVISVEVDLLDTSHTELGAELARHWDLPESIVTTLRHHHTPNAINEPLVNLLHLAEKILPDLGIAEHISNDIAASDWQTLDIDPARAEELIAAVREHAEQARQVASTF